MKHLRILALAATAMLAGATMASAQEAFTTNDVNMRAGPGNRFPAVAMIPEDANVYIHGCLSNWDWCDVSWRRARGWVFSDYLEAYYHNRRIGFDEYRDYVDIPFVSFGFGYWDRYYRDRPWFDQWDRWGGNNGNWRDRNHHNGGGGGDWNNNNGDGDWNQSGDRNNGGDWNRTGNDNGDQADDNTDNNNNDNGRIVRRDRRNANRPDMNGPGMRCGTENASADCPPTSHGRQMQQYQQ